MKKITYEKPEITIITLNEEVILASGQCIDHYVCLDDDCDSDYCRNDCGSFTCHNN